MKFRANYGSGIDLFYNMKIQWLRQKRIILQRRKPGFDPWVGKIPWKREWQLNIVFLSRESHGQRSLVSYSPWGSQRARHNGATNTHTHTHTVTQRFVRFIFPSSFPHPHLSFFSQSEGQGK